MTGRVPRRKTRLSRAIRPSVLVAAFSQVLAAFPVAADDNARETHIIDSSTDRTPARTAFPSYPRIARRDRIEGDATICFRIDKRGRIRSIRVRDVSHPIFRRAALRAIRASSFEPLKPNEVLATARTCRTYRFRLEPVLADNNEG